MAAGSDLDVHARRAGALRAGHRQSRFRALGNSTTRDTLLNDHFPYATTAAWNTFGGAFEPGKLENTYHLFSAGGRDYIVIALEWGPRDPVIAWANK